MFRGSAHMRRVWCGTHVWSVPSFTLMKTIAVWGNRNLEVFVTSWILYYGPLNADIKERMFAHQSDIWPCLASPFSPDYCCINIELWVCITFCTSLFCEFSWCTVYDNCKGKYRYYGPLMPQISLQIVQCLFITAGEKDQKKKKKKMKGSDLAERILNCNITEMMHSSTAWPLIGAINIS